MLSSRPLQLKCHCSKVMLKSMKKRSKICSKTSAESLMIRGGSTSLSKSKRKPTKASSCMMPRKLILMIYNKIVKCINKTAFRSTLRNLMEVIKWALFRRITNLTILLMSMKLSTNRHFSMPISIIRSTTTLMKPIRSPQIRFNKLSNREFSVIPEL